MLQVVTGGRGGIKKVLILRYVIFEQPLCVRLSSGETRRRLLSNAKSLKNSATEWHKKVFVGPDLTPAQRDKDPAARDELKRRKKSAKKKFDNWKF